jgi:hypothetical protein
MITYRILNRILITTALILAGLLTGVTAQIQNWSLTSPSGSVPAARGGHAMVYDSTHGRMVMFGGASASGTLNDVWEFDVSTKTWTNVTPFSGPAPSPRSGFAMAYDPFRDKVVMHGGSTAPFAHPGDTWEWDTVNRSWAYMPNGGIGGGHGLLGSTMAFDPNRNQIILFGGRQYFNNGVMTTYAWNGNNWTNISPSTSPSGRAYHMMATDTERSKIVLFGGWQGNLLNDTWEWDGSTWTEIPTATRPVERHLSGMSYDSERGVIVLFGGWSGYNPNYPWNDTWTWNGQSWTQQQPCDLPLPRNSVAMAYDPIRKRHVMFGGGGAGGSTNDTWFYGTGLGSFPCGDANAPVTSANSTSPNAAGWNNSDTAIQLQAFDGEDGTGVQDITYSASGAQTIAPTVVTGANANFTIVAEGETTIIYFATDNAGNSEEPQSVLIKIDKTPPSISVNSPTSGNYLLNQAATVDYSCTDALSGVASCTRSSANGSTFDTGSIGAKSFSVTATDVAGHTVTTIIDYTVGYGILALYDQSKAHKAGSTVPIKVRLVDANGNNVSSPALLPHAVSVIQVSSQASNEFGDSGNSNPDHDFRYDVSFEGYLFNLKTTGFGTGSYLLNFTVGDPAIMYSAGFQVRQ